MKRLGQLLFVTPQVGSREIDVRRNAIFERKIPTQREAGAVAIRQLKWQRAIARRRCHLHPLDLAAQSAFATKRVRRARLERKSVDLGGLDISPIFVKRRTGGSGQLEHGTGTIGELHCPRAIAYQTILGDAGLLLRRLKRFVFTIQNNFRLAAPLRRERQRQPQLVA